MTTYRKKKKSTASLKVVGVFVQGFQNVIKNWDRWMKWSGQIPVQTKVQIGVKIPDDNCMIIVLLRNKIKNFKKENVRQSKLEA